MWRMLVSGLMIVLAASAARGDELTDSLLGVDPRAGLGSGTGAVYGDVYGPEQPDDASPLSEVEAEDEANAAFLGDYSGLRSPLFMPAEPGPAESAGELPSTLDASTLDLPSEAPARPRR